MSTPCPGFAPNPWRKKKCKHCGHAQSSHFLPPIDNNLLPKSPDNDTKKEVTPTNSVSSPGGFTITSPTKQGSSSAFLAEYKTHQRKESRALSDVSTPTKERSDSRVSMPVYEGTPVAANPRASIKPVEESSSTPRVRSESVANGKQIVSAPHSSDDVHATIVSNGTDSNSSQSSTVEIKGSVSSEETPTKREKKEKKVRREKSEKKIKKEKSERRKEPSGTTPRERQNSVRAPKEKDEDDMARGGAMESKEQIGDYILVDKLGKGAYGVVYKAINMFEGNTVAVKKLNLKGCTKEVVDSLTAEIALLRSLAHENIVHYIDHIKTPKELFIVMEFVENGSLAAMVKKYGRFPEPLAKTYTRKVLVGLDYLHDQGVIHRDIKPDNILITKNGEVKLADFGVSTKLASASAGAEDETVPAGTPYYMAPEVIEFYGARTNSDIWSLGCTVIELLRGEPPYFSMDPFSAMYKMVEDEHPPLPLGISQALYLFLMECFKKDVNFRCGAKDLMKHSWLVVDKQKANTPSRSEFSKIASEISAYNENLEREIGVSTEKTTEEEELKEVVMKSQTLNATMATLMKSQFAARGPPKKQPAKAAETKAPAPAAAAAAPLKLKLPAPETDDLDWDDAFADSPKLGAKVAEKPTTPSSQDNLKAKFKMAGLEGLDLDGPASDEKFTLSAFGAGNATLSNLKLGASDVADETDWDKAFEKLETPKKTDSLKKVNPPSNKPNNSPLQLKLSNSVNVDDLDWGDDDEDWGAKPVQAKTPVKPPTSPKKPVAKPKAAPAKQLADKSKLLNEMEKSDKVLDAFKEDDEDFSDVDVGSLKGTISKRDKSSFGSNSGGTVTGKSSLVQRLENKKAQEWADDWDDELVLVEDEAKDEKSLLRERAQEALLAEIKFQLRQLKPNQAEEDIKKACLKLMEVFDKNPEMKSHLITNHGILPLITLLNNKNTVIINSVLRLITQIIDGTTEILVNTCVMGIIPIIMECGSSQSPILTRLYSAYFVQRVISTTETLQMFVACRGLSLLTAFLEPDYSKFKDIVHISINCVSSIFKIQNQTATPKNEYFHLFLTTGLLEKLSVTLVNLLMSEEDQITTPDVDEDEELTYVQKVSKIFKVFSMGDSEVKLAICNPEILSNIKKAMTIMSPRSKEIFMLLNTIRNVSFDRAVLTNLSGLIVPLLDIAMVFVNKGEFLPEVFNQVTHSLFHICRLNRSRQETAVKAGLIQFLLFVINNNKPLKEFAVPLMCELANSSPTTRKILLENGGLAFYLNLLRDDKGTFLTDALEAIAICLEQERSSVESILSEEDSIEALKDAFGYVKEHEVEKILESMKKILTISSQLAALLGADPTANGFVGLLRDKLHHPSNVARVKLLQSLSLLSSRYADPPHFLYNNNLLKVVTFMAENDNSALVRNMAQTLLNESGKE